MRPKFVFTIIAAGFLTVAALLMLRPHSHPGVASAQSSEATAGASADPLGGAITGSGSSRRPPVPPQLPAAGSRRLYAARGPRGTGNSADQPEIALTAE